MAYVDGLGADTARVERPPDWAHAILPDKWRVGAEQRDEPEPFFDEEHEAGPQCGDEDMRC